jgi:hypothetical protein
MSQAIHDGDEFDELAVEDFGLVGPVGFMLDREQWLDRFRGRDLVVSSLTWNGSRVRRLTDAAVVVGVHAQQAAYRGQQSDGQLRVAQVWVRTVDTWKLASLHLRQIIAPPCTGSRPSGPPDDGR